GDVADDRQPEPGTTRLPAAGPVHTVEALEDALEVTGGNSDAVVLDGHVHRPAVGAAAAVDGGVIVGGLTGVVEQVVDRGDELAAVAVHCDPRRHLAHVEAHAAGVGRAAYLLDGLGHEQVHRHRLAHRGLLGFEPGEVEQVTDDVSDAVGLGLHA